MQVWYVKNVYLRVRIEIININMILSDFVRLELDGLIKLMVRGFK